MLVHLSTIGLRYSWIFDTSEGTTATKVTVVQALILLYIVDVIHDPILHCSS